MRKKNGAPGTDENLVEMHRKARKRQSRKLIITMSVIVVVVLVVVAVGVTVLRRQVSATVNASSSSSVESAEVTVGSISTTVSGSGTLADEDVETIEIPGSLEIADYYVEEGDTVEEGDLIATVTNASLLSAMSDAQASLDALDAELEEAFSEEVDEEVTASVSGRVKYIYAEEDDDVVSVMYENGALVLLSLDGYMAVDVETNALSEGDSVTVTASDDTEYDGTVDTVVSGVATILIDDDGPEYGDTVMVTDSDGEEIGRGELSIHSKMAVTGYAGTVEEVSVSVDDEVDAGDTLLTLTDTETSANYDTILKEREEAEELLADLVAIYKEGGIYATTSGEISSLSSGSSGSSDSSYSDAFTASTSSTSSSTATALSATTTATTALSATAAAMTATTTTSAATATATTATTTASATADSTTATSTSSTSSTTSASSSDYTTIAEISLNKSMTITISVDETDILSLEEGQTASVTIDSVSDEAFEGEVTSISTSATSSSGVTTYSAVVTIDKTDDMLSGMSASVSITIEGVENALLIPVDALHQTSSTSYVYTEYDEDTGEFSGMVEVTTGLSNSSYVEITDGLSEGDTVYYTESSSDSSSTFGFGDMSDFSGMDSMPGGGSMGGDSSSGGFSGGMPGN